MKILVFSDSHKVNNQMTNILNTVKYDFAIHLGDSCENENFMKKYFKYYVGGNNDFFGKDYEIIKIKNFRFLLTHGHYEYSFNYDKWLTSLVDLAKTNKCNAVIFGHSHQTEDTTIDGIRILNPGSISYPRDTNKSYMEISINEKLKVDIKYLAS